MQTKTLEKGNKQILELTLDRNNRDYIYLQTSKEIENFFKQLTDNEIVESNNWHNSEGELLKFYRYDHNTEKPFTSFAEDFFHDYGQELISYSNSGVRGNTGIIRTVGIADGITIRIENRHAKDALIEALKEIRRFTKKVYIKFIRDVRISTSLKITEI